MSIEMIGFAAVCVAISAIGAALLYASVERLRTNF